MSATRTKSILSVQPVCDGGGSEHALIRMIRELTADGWDCHVVVPGPARLEGDYVAAGAALHLVPMLHVTSVGSPLRWGRFAAQWPLSVGRLVALIRRLDVSVVHSNSLHCWYAWAAAAVTRKPHVWHAREIVFQSPAALRLERFLVRRFAAQVVAVSSAIASQLDAGNVEVVLDDADPVEFHPARAGRFRSAAALADDLPLVGCVSRLDVWKGVDVLLDAFPLVRAARPEAELVIAGPVVPGKDAYAAALESRALEQPGVHWAGPRSDVADLMADLDVFAQVSTRPEPFGLVLVEALASGVPVVAGSEGGPLEILGPEAVDGPVPAGRLIPPGDPRALAAAVLELLPPGPSSLQARRSRQRLREPVRGGLAAVFDRVTASQGGAVMAR